MQTLILPPSSQTKIHIFIEDITVNDGGGLTGLTPASPGLKAAYICLGQTSPTSLTLVNSTLDSFVEGGFVEIDSTNMPGWYELQLPAECTSLGFLQTSIQLSGAKNMATTNIVLLERKRFFCRFDPKVYAGQTISIGT